MSFLYHALIADPIINAMVLIYNYLPIKDIGIAIIILTLIIRLFLLPLSYKAARTQREIAKIQPKLKEIQKKFKDNREEQAKMLMALYKEHKINPLAGIIPILIQLPVLIALYRAFMTIISDINSATFYSFVSAPETINPMFLGLINLAKPSIYLAIIAGLLQFAFSRITSIKTKKDKKDKGKQTGMGAMMSSQMTYFLPIITVFFGMRLPAGLPLYWATTTIFSISEQFWAKRSLSQKDKENLPQKS
jgi:YidC/Oxa1 family membrane protein insertase